MIITKFIFFTLGFPGSPAHDTGEEPFAMIFANFVPGPKVSKLVVHGLELLLGPVAEAETLSGTLGGSGVGDLIQSCCRT